MRNEHHAIEQASRRWRTRCEIYLICTQVKPALDTKGNLVGPDAVNPKYGTPKCEFHCQLAKLPGGGYVGAHPSLGEKAAVALLQRSPVLGDVWTGAREKAEIRREVTGPRGQDMRADFVIGGSEKECVLEVKTVVDASCDTGVGAEEEESAFGSKKGRRKSAYTMGEKESTRRALKEKLGLELSAHLRMQAKLMTQLHDNVLPVVAGADGSTSAGGASSDGGGGDGGDDDDESSDGATAAAPSAGEDAKTTVKRENGGSIALERPKRQRAAAVASS